MTATQVQLKETTVEFINSLITENYAQDDIYEFIEQYGEDSCVNLYEQYVECGEDYSYEAVDAFIEEFGIQSFTATQFGDAYMGQWESKEQYAENYVTDCYSIDIPNFVEIDWEATFDNLDVTITFDGYVFNTQF